MVGIPLSIGVSAPLFECAKVRDWQLNAAVHQAGAALSEVTGFVRRVELMAQDRDIRALVNHSDLLVRADALERYSDESVSNLFVLSPSGRMLARWPHIEHEPETRDYSFRDYFRGACSLDRQVGYIGRAVIGKITRRPELEIAVPMLDGAGALIGVVVGARMARSTFGGLAMDCRSTECTTTVFAPHDRESSTEGLPDTLTVLAAKGLPEKSWIATTPELASQVCGSPGGCIPRPRPSDGASPFAPRVFDYADPVSTSIKVGAFAAVGSTGLIVAVSRDRSMGDFVLGLVDPVSPLQLVAILLSFVVALVIVVLKRPVVVAPRR
ncbi:MAG TPA: hypothetical protein VMG12_41830 [Polyangiaceae bacterium]|nr:hypothetical protein [Polyangiaceae bacterium]